VLALLSSQTYAAWLLLLGWFPMFMAGYFYNERLRQLDRESRFPGWRRPPGA
jgi:hypothetical protein